MYSAPGTFGSVTATRLTVRHEIAAKPRNTSTGQQHHAGLLEPPPRGDCGGRMGVIHLLSSSCTQLRAASSSAMACNGLCVP
jgi:hypothetical protein